MSHRFRQHCVTIFRAKPGRGVALEVVFQTSDKGPGVDDICSKVYKLNWNNNGVLHGNELGFVFSVMHWMRYELSIAKTTLRS